MTHTANYQLSQWEKSDRILMSDFNDDNTKIDAAIKEAEEKAPFVYLRTITVEADTTQVDVDVSTFDWDAYPHLLVQIRGESSRVDGGGVYMNGHLENGDSLGGFMVRYDTKNQFSDLWITGNIEYPECHYIIYGSGSQKTVSSKYAEPLTTLTLKMYLGELKAGSIIRLYGSRY